VRPEQRRLICTILHDLSGTLFHRQAIDPGLVSRKGGKVRKIAQTIYDTRAFDRMPELADALQEAGCTSTDVLDHCRQLREHVRGCWVLDLLLGKE
jgi:hypothetical protein